MTGGSYWYSMHCAVAHSVSRVTQRMAGWRDSALPAEWVAAVTVARPMSDSTLPHSSISYDTNSIQLIKCYSPDAVSHLSHRPLISFISHAHMISLLLYHLSFIPDPSSISPMFTYHHWHLIYCHIYQQVVTPVPVPSIYSDMSILLFICIYVYVYLYIFAPIVLDDMIKTIR